MEEDGYQSITDFDSIMQYIDDMGGFHDLPIGSIQYDGSELSVGIEEVLEGQSWPSDATGRVWFMNFSHVSDITLDIDMAVRLWIKDTYLDEEGNFVFECDQGSVSVLANGIELQVPVDANAKQGGSFLATNADDAPLNMKNIFNDIKGIVTNHRGQNESEEPEAAETPIPAATPEPVEPAPNPFLNQAPTPEPVAPAPEVASQPVAPASPNIAPTPVAPAPAPATPAPAPAPAAMPARRAARSSSRPRLPTGLVRLSRRATAASRSRARTGRTAKFKSVFE